MEGINNIEGISILQKTHVRKNHIRKSGVSMDHFRFANEMIKILFAKFRHKLNILNVTFVPKTLESKELAVSIFKSMISTPEEDYSISVSYGENRHVSKQRCGCNMLSIERYFDVDAPKGLKFKNEYLQLVISDDMTDILSMHDDLDEFKLSIREYKDVCISYNRGVAELLKKHNLLD